MGTSFSTSVETLVLCILCLLLHASHSRLASWCRLRMENKLSKSFLAISLNPSCTNFHTWQRIAVKVRSVLCCTIYKKSLLLGTDAFEKTNTGQALPLPKGHGGKQGMSAPSHTLPLACCTSDEINIGPFILFGALVSNWSQKKLFTVKCMKRYAVPLR